MDKVNVNTKGVTFPIYLTDNGSGKQGWNISIKQTDLIENNLTSLIGYELGQRMHQEDFGTRLWECLEEPNSQALNFLVTKFLREAIEAWEPRIEFQRSEIIRDHHKLYIKFFYRIKSNNTLASASVSYDLDYEK